MEFCRHFAEDKCIFFNYICCVLIQISLKLVPKSSFYKCCVGSRYQGQGQVKQPNASVGRNYLSLFLMPASVTTTLLNYQWVIIGSDNRLASVRWHAFIWTKDGLVFASLGLSRYALCGLPQWNWDQTWFISSSATENRQPWIKRIMGTKKLIFQYFLIFFTKPIHTNEHFWAGRVLKTNINRNKLIYWIDQSKSFQYIQSFF